MKHALPGAPPIDAVGQWALCSPRVLCTLRVPVQDQLPEALGAPAQLALLAEMHPEDSGTFNSLEHLPRVAGEYRQLWAVCAHAIK